MSEPRTYRVFSHITGLVLFELVFWMLAAGLYFLVRSAAPQFELHLPGYWPALLAPPLSLLLFAGHYRWKQRRMARAVDLDLAQTLWPDARPRRSVWKFLVWRTGLAIMAMGMLAPKLGTRLNEVEAKGVDIMIALDVSRSMMAEDLGMSRLDLAKRTIERIVAKLDGDRVGLVVFAGDAYVQAPLTLDLTAVKLFLDAVGPDAVPKQGTAIGSAVARCMESFDPESQASKVVLVLTDGENHEDDALARASEAANKGIQVHAAGMASEGGGPIPEFDRYGRSKGYKSDASGQPVVSTLDERMLVSMVEAGQGTYVRARPGFVDLDPFFDGISTLETGETSTVAYTDFVHHFPWFFLCGWLLILLEGWWPSSPRYKAALAITLLLIAGGRLQAQSGLTPGTKAQAVAGTEAMQERNYALADSLFEAGQGWEGAEPGQLELNRGMALAGSGDTQGALRAFQRSADAANNPGIKADAWNNVGNVLLGSQDVDGAIEAYKQSLRLDPYDAETRYNLNLALAMRQKQQEQEQQQGEDQQDGGEDQQSEENQAQQGGEGEQEKDPQDSGEEQQEPGEEEQQGGEGEQEEDPDGRNESQEEGEQDQQDGEGQQDQGQQDGEEGQQGTSPSEGEEQPSREGQIQPADAERILDMLERNEAALRAKLQAQENAKRNKGKQTKIEKDW